ncbi:MAG TPA: hypothetical protein VGR07_20525, partial [Thermoanaerobaculia bacterium]|nr:hypothetical protein [Thermoanaerobaculia bacterium]
MDPGILNEIVSVIKAERQRRLSERQRTLSRLEDDLDQEIVYDQWLSEDIPLLNELCLMVLVTLRHEVERELVILAARSADGGREIDNPKYQENVKQLK